MRRSLFAAVLSAAFVAALFASIYALRGHPAPVGFDTARYLWRNHCVAEEGLRGLRDVCRPPLATSMPGRVGYPLVTLPAAAATGAGPFTMAAAAPAALAATIGLAAAALVRATAGGGALLLASVAVTVGASPMVARLAGPESYADNMLAAALGLGALAMAAGAPGRPWRGLGGVALLGAAGLSHWPTFAIFTAMAGGVALLALPEALRSRRSRGAVLGSACARFALTAAGGAAAWALGAAIIRAGPDRFFADPGSAAAKLASDMSGYAPWITIPLAIAGALAFGRLRTERARLLEWILVAWISVIALAVAAWILDPALPSLLRSLGAGFPLHRFLALALPVPILAGLAVAAAGDAVATRRGRVAGAAVALLLLGAWALIGGRLLLRNVAFMDLGRVRDASAAAAYLEGAVPPGTPVVVVVDGVGDNPFTGLYQVADNLRIPLDPRRIGDLRLYLGDANLLESGQPTTGRGAAHDQASLFRWRGVEPVLTRRHASIVLASTYPGFGALARERPERLAAPGVLVLEGPLPDRVAGPAAPVRPLDPIAPLAAALALLVLWGAVGWGWTGRGGEPSRAVRLALAPAAGLAALILAGVIADLAGVRAAGPGGLGVAALAAGAGLAWHRLRDRSRSV